MWVGQSEKQIKAIFINYKKMADSDELAPILFSMKRMLSLAVEWNLMQTAGQLTKWRIQFFMENNIETRLMVILCL
ncbi:hypothetical protein FACS189447_09570 [Spirochaetia bacterium]|nr:hypothetical protein FACS189447_09570 [Spirochaetia bacterium]